MTVPTRQLALKDILHVNDIHVAIFNELKPQDPNLFTNFSLHLSQSVKGTGSGVGIITDLPFISQ